MLFPTFHVEPAPQGGYHVIALHKGVRTVLKHVGAKRKAEAERNAYRDWHRITGLIRK